MKLRLSGHVEVEVEALQVLGDRLVVQRLADDAQGYLTKAGVWLPQAQQSARAAVLQGTVVATGPLVSADVPVGARVLVERWGRVALDEAGEFWVTSEDQVSAVLQL